MRKHINHLYIIAWVLYATSAFFLFPIFNVNLHFPIIAIIGLGGWLYGRSLGLVLIILEIFHHFFIYQYFADIYAYYPNRVTGTFLCIAITFVTGNLRQRLDAIKEANRRLDAAVTERTAELASLTHRLVSNAESARTSRGQELHDGIGQQLTCIQLYATSIAEHLLDEANPAASLAHSVCNRARSIHKTIRKTARSLFPVQINEVGLLPALEEMAASMGDLKQTRINIETADDPPSLRPAVALQLYRICQETSLYIITHSHASQLDIRIDVSTDKAELSIRHDGESLADRLRASNEARLIGYRLDLIHGTQEARPSGNGSEAFVFAAPNPWDPT
jgi:glucose-6-phosphate-specific signal transduction histidine kinase